MRNMLRGVRCVIGKRRGVARGEQQLFHAGYALERVHIDIMGPLMETQKGNKYILVIVDQFTKWVELKPFYYKINWLKRWQGW